MAVVGITSPGYKSPQLGNNLKTARDAGNIPKLSC